MDDARAGWEAITEQVTEWRDAGLSVDTEARVVRNIVLCGAVSRNGHRYRLEALRDGVSLYPGKPVFLDHAPNAAKPMERSTRDLAGTILAARYVDERIVGDIQVLETEAGRTFLALAAGEPSAFGMSHVVLARRGTPPQVIDKLHEVVSVDAVVFPATTSGLREASDPDTDEVLVLREQLAMATGELERLRAELRRRDDEQAIGGLLAASGLPDGAITPVFREQLARLPDDAARRMWIDDRVRLLRESRERAVISRGRRDTVEDVARREFLAVVKPGVVGVLCGGVRK